MSAERIAIVTGGNRGIGYEICRRLARERVHVVLCARDVRIGAAAAAQLCSEQGTVEAQALDVTDERSVADLARWLEQRFGRVDILVNNAAILIDRVACTLDVEPRVLQQMLDTNVCGPFRMARALAPLLRNSRCARIVNMSSGLARVQIDATDRPAYRLSKAALNALTRMLAFDLAPDIKVNAMSPGWVRTGMGGTQAPRTPEQGADTAVWLALLPEDGPTGGFFMDRKPIPW
jgi:NAD(P)-dependent dehydrogenase (short-subunit alcohol dehydrogenase family)